MTLIDNHDANANLGGATIDESKNSAILKRNETPIANMFFKFCHRDTPNRKNGNRERRLTNKYQELILDELLKVLEKRLGQQKKEA